MKNTLEWRTRLGYTVAHLRDAEIMYRLTDYNGARDMWLLRHACCGMTPYEISEMARSVIGKARVIGLLAARKPNEYA
jgi:hypothetical protein